MLYKDLITIAIPFITLMWLTINEIQKRRKINIRYEPGLFFTEDGKMDWFFEVTLINKSTRSIGIKKIVFLMNKKIIPIRSLDVDLKNYGLINADLLLKDVVYDEKVIENYLCQDNFVVAPNSEMKSSFNYRDLRLFFQENPNAKFKICCEDLAGNKSYKKITKKTISEMKVEDLHPELFKKN